MNMHPATFVYLRYRSVESNTLCNELSRALIANIIRHGAVQGVQREHARCKRGNPLIKSRPPACARSSPAGAR
jgi:hypothetical protein